MKKTITIYCQNTRTGKYRTKKVDAERVDGLFPGFDFYVHMNPSVEQNKKLFPVEI